MPQNALPFKLEASPEKLTAHGGLVIFGEFLHSLGLAKMLDRLLPAPGSGAGYQPRQFVTPLVLMLHGGGRSLEDLRQIREDAGLRILLKLEELPSTDATGDWLRRMGASGGLEDLGATKRQVLRRGLKREERPDYTLDMDASQVEAEKEAAKWTYKGVRGYMPMVGHLAENGLIVGEEFRAGNDSPGARNLEFVQYCEAQMPKGKRIARLRADSASYQAAVINHCEDHDIRFAIGADLDAGVRAAIAAIPAAAWRPYQNGLIAETVHSMATTKQAFRLLVIKRPLQAELFEGLTLERESEGRQHVIASNRIESAEETVAWYNQRGECSENRLKELKLGFGMERMPCGDFGANAVFFRLGALAYNLFVLFKLLTLPGAWRRCQVQTLRWRFYQTAGKVIRHGRGWVLRVSQAAFAVLDEARARCRELRFAPS